VSQEEALFISPSKPPREIKDSYEEESSGGGIYKSALEVILRPPENFNANEYQTVASSQPSQQSYPSQSTSNPASTSSQPQPRPKPPKRPFLWDEEIKVADSQELPGSSSYKPPETQASGTRPDTATDTDVEPVRSTYLPSSRDETGGSSSESRLAESLEYRPSTSNIVDSQHISEERSTGETSTETREETTQEHSLESRLAANSSSRKAVQDSTTQSGSSVHLEVSTPPEIESSSGEPLDPSSAVAGGPSSEETSHIPPRAESPPNRQPDYPDFPSGFPFLTQLPLLESDDSVIGEEAVESVEVR
jgi:hypothetical protein